MILRELLLKLGLEIDEASFAEGEVAAEIVKGVFEKLVEASHEVVEGFTELVLETAEAAHHTEELAQITGLSTEEIQDLGTAAEKSGSSTEALGTSVGFLSRQMLAAKEGSKEASELFNKLGIKVKDSEGHLRSAGDVLLDLSDHFHSLPDGAEKTALAMKTLGRQGAQLIPMLNKGREEIAALAATSANFTEEQIEAGKDLTIGVAQLRGSWKTLLKEAVFPLLPAVSALVKRARDFVEKNRAFIKLQLARVMKGVLTIITALGKTLGAMIVALKFVTDHWKVLAEILGGVVLAAVIANREALAELIVEYGKAGIAALVAGAKAAAGWLLAVLPFALIALGIAGILIVLDDLYSALKGGPSLISDQLAAWKAFFSSLWNDPALQQFRDVWEEIGVKWRKFVDMWKIGAAELRDAWREVVADIEKRIQPLIDSSEKVMALYRQFVGNTIAPSSISTGGAGGSTFGAGTSSISGAFTNAVTRANTEMARRQLPEPELKFRTDTRGNLVAFSPQFKAEFHIAVRPGQSPEDAARAAQDQFDSWYDRKMEEARASAGGY